MHSDGTVLRPRLRRREYVGVSLKLDYDKRTLDKWVPGCVNQALIKYQHPKPSQKQHSPAKTTPMQYSTKNQEAIPQDETPQLVQEEIKYIQSIVEHVDYSSREMDPMMAAILSLITGKWARATKC